jgi:hypothetical protein
MKIPCDVIVDLLPLYHDGVCSENSKKIIADHLSECESCKSVLEKIKNTTVDNFLQIERGEVIHHHKQEVKRKSLAVGFSIALVMAIPVLACLIVNLATGHALDWFFIVLTALMTLASITVIPLIFEKEKFLWTLGSFTFSLTLLLVTCAIYNRGDWFFVAIIPVLFGLSLLFAPYVLNKLPLKGFMAHHKGLLAMALDTLFLYAVIVVSGLYLEGSTLIGYWQPALLITSVCLLFPWGLFLIIRYIRANLFIKTGLGLIFGGLFLSVIENIVYWITDGIFRFQFKNANLLVWNNSAVINANVLLLILLTGCIIGAILLAIGLLRITRIRERD